MMCFESRLGNGVTKSIQQRPQKSGQHQFAVRIIARNGWRIPHCLNLSISGGENFTTFLKSRNLAAKLSPPEIPPPPVLPCGPVSLLKAHFQSQKPNF